MRALLIAGMATAFANTNAGCKLYICTTPQPTDLTSTSFAALTWVAVTGVGKIGETGTKTNILSYDTWDTTTIDKAKGMSDAGNPEVEVARDVNDAGQNAMIAAALTNKKYAFKIARNDTATTTPSIQYQRGLIVGPMHPNGKNEDFDLSVFTLGLVQQEVDVAPT